MTYGIDNDKQIWSKTMINYFNIHQDKRIWLLIPDLLDSLKLMILIKFRKYEIFAQIYNNYSQRRSKILNRDNKLAKQHGLKS